MIILIYPAALLYYSPIKAVEVPFFDVRGVRTLIVSLSLVLDHYYKNPKQVPKSLEEAIKQVKNTKQFNELLKEDSFIRLWRDGYFIDPWGNKLRWRDTDKGKLSPYNMRKNIYSIGPNGIDEGGKGDDINSE